MRDLTLPPEQLVIERFEFRGFHGCRSFCQLELTRISRGRTLAIATELAGNPGTSITNVAEYLASFVCDRFGVAPDDLIWVEHYGYPAPRESVRTYDRVTFSRRVRDVVVWLPAVTNKRPSGWPGYLSDPVWRPMQIEDWQGLSLIPRRPVNYE